MLCAPTGLWGGMVCAGGWGGVVHVVGWGSVGGGMWWGGVRRWGWVVWCVLSGALVCLDTVFPIYLITISI